MSCAPMLLAQIHDIHFKEFCSNLSHTDIHSSGGIYLCASISVHLFSCRKSRYGGAESLYMPYNSISSTAGVAVAEVPEVFRAEFEKNLVSVYCVFIMSNLSFPLFKYNTFCGSLLRT